VAVIADGVCLERSLILLLQLLSVSDRVVLCVNLLDEAEKKGIRVELRRLSSRLGIPVVGLSAREGRGIEEAIRLFEEAGASEGALRPREGEDLTALARAIASETLSGTENAHRRDRRIDRWLTGKYTAFPLMFCMLLGILWLTVSGANLPSEWLFDGFSWLEGVLLGGMEALGAPWWLSGALVLGICRTVAWVVSVMLPPMAIFFPLFTILEDLGVLPRVAYNLDRCFRGCRASGKQALTM
jgi:ferrous iron transport protein B